MHRFLIPPGCAPGDTIELSPAESHHALRVLRLAPGAKVQLSDGRGGLFQAELMSGGDAGARVRLIAACDGAEPPVWLTLYQGLPKFDKLELICQKATELGASRIVPVRTERTVVKLSAEDGEKRAERLRRICAEAAKQCGRAALPDVLAPMPLARALELMRAEPIMLMPWESARGLTMSNVAADRPDADGVGIFIGPEGGISESEAAQAESAGAIAITLGPRILRTETAAIAAMAMAMQLWGDA